VLSQEIRLLKGFQTLFLGARHNGLTVMGISAPFLPPLSGSRSFDLLVKNLNGKNYTMTFNNLLKPISVEGSSRKVGTSQLSEICRSLTKRCVRCLTLVQETRC